MSAITTDAAVIAVRGKPVRVRVVRIGRHEMVVTGTALKVARLREEWDDDIDDPESVIAGLKSCGDRIDLFTFMQRLPESRPQYEYPREWDNVAALPISTYEQWLEKQVHPNHRNKVRKAAKEGVEIRRVQFSDDFVTAVMSILNEVPVRQGVPFRDYGKDFETVKAEHVTYINRSDFLGAYCGGELVGYLKLVSAGRFTRTMQILSMVRHRPKGPTNALIAEAVRICAERGSPYLVYGKYDYGRVGSDTLREFKAFNGFEHVLLPRYFVPLTSLGRVAVRCNLHHGVVGVLPRGLVRTLLSARKSWYSGSDGVSGKDKRA
jgi:hypothetical protein